VVAQAIAKIRLALRKSKTCAVPLQTVYAQGYRLIADAHVQAADDVGTALLPDLHPAQPALAVVPLADDGMRPRFGGDDVGYAVEVLGYAMAVHAGLKRMSAAEVQAGIDAATEATVQTPDAIAAAINLRSPGADVLFARIARRDADTLSLDYLLISRSARAEGSMQDRSPAVLGRRLAAKRVRLHAQAPQDVAHAADDTGWATQMLDLASRAAEEHRWDAARRILDVLLDQDPDHCTAAELKARIDAAHGVRTAA
jgi:hypothetical protein